MRVSFSRAGVGRPPQPVTNAPAGKMYPEEEQRPHLRLQTHEDTRCRGPASTGATGYAPDSTRFFSPPSARATIIFTA